MVYIVKWSHLLASLLDGGEGELVAGAEGPPGQDSLAPADHTGPLLSEYHPQHELRGREHGGLLQLSGESLDEVVVGDDLGSDGVVHPNTVLVGHTVDHQTSHVLHVDPGHHLVRGFNYNPNIFKSSIKELEEHFIVLNI